MKTEEELMKEIRDIQANAWLEFRTIAMSSPEKLEELGYPLEIGKALLTIFKIRDKEIDVKLKEILKSGMVK